MKAWTAATRQNLSTLPIRTKLWLVSGLVMLALVSIPALSWYRDAAIRDMDDTRLEIQALDTMVLALQRNQSDFINTYDPVYREKFSLIFEDFVFSTEELKVRFWDLDLSIDTLERLVALTSEYQYMFDVMADTMTEIGATDRDGFRGELGGSLDRLLDVLSQLPEAGGQRYRLQFQATMLRLPARGLLANRNRENMRLFRTRARDLDKTIRTAIEAPALRTAALDSLGDARLAFDMLANNLTKVGLDHDQGLLGDIERTVSASQAVIADLRAQVNAAIAQRERNLNTLMGVMSVAFAALFVIATLLVNRAISTPIRDVTQAMTRLADGDLNVDLPSEGRRDEIGDMFRALRIFKMGAIIRRRTQEELRHAHDELEQRVTERTAALEDEVAERRRAEKNLRTAREQAEAANHAKSVFLANMSHELRTPLNAIIGYAEMLKEDAQDQGDSRLVDDLDKIHGAGKHLLGIINEILDLSKIEAGRFVVHLETFTVRDIVETVANTVKPLVAENGNIFHVETGEGLGLMESDTTRVRQILFNFLSNAAKFTENGTVTLSCARETHQNGDVIRFTIADTGIGMDADQLQQIFEPFTQADASTSRRYGGTGLGLTVNREFARLLGGEIHVKSTPGAGTTFTVCLPVVPPAAIRGDADDET